jgi:hypothetical protein
MPAIAVRDSELSGSSHGRRAAAINNRQPPRPDTLNEGNNHYNEQVPNENQGKKRNRSVIDNGKDDREEKRTNHDKPRKRTQSSALKGNKIMTSTMRRTTLIRVTRRRMMDGRLGMKKKTLGGRSVIWAERNDTHLKHGHFFRNLACSAFFCCSIARFRI